MELWYWVVWLVVAGLGAFVSARIASGKGYGPVGFAILGLILPLVGVIVAAVLPRKKIAAQKQGQDTRAAQ